MTIQYAGARVSDYGAQDPDGGVCQGAGSYSTSGGKVDFGSPLVPSLSCPCNNTASFYANYWTGVAKGMSQLFPGSQPCIVYIVGDIVSGEFPAELSGLGLVSGYGYSSAGTQANSDTMISAYNAAGVRVIIQVEPDYPQVSSSGSTNLVANAKKLMQYYSKYPNVIGFGVDNEWYKGTMSSTVANNLVSAVHSVNSSYIIFIKHYDQSKLPKGITGMTYCTDTMGFSSESQAVGNYVAGDDSYAGFAATFAPNPIAYQFGYDEYQYSGNQTFGGGDLNWLNPLGTNGQPALKLIQDLQAKIPTSQQIQGVFWVDFTIASQFPTSSTGGGTCIGPPTCNLKVT